MAPPLTDRPSLRGMPLGAQQMQAAQPLSPEQSNEVLFKANNHVKQAVCELTEKLEALGLLIPAPPENGASGPETTELKSPYRQQKESLAMDLHAHAYQIQRLTERIKV